MDELQQQLHGNTLGETAAAHRHGKIVVIRKGGALPAFCFRCGIPADAAPELRTFRWHHPGFYFVLFLGVLPYFLVAYLVQEKGEIRLTACRRHRKFRLTAHLVGSFGVVAGIVMAGVGNRYDEWGYFMSGIILVVLFAIGSMIAGRSLVPTRIDAHYLYLEGAGDAFLNQLPDRAEQQYRGNGRTPTTASPVRGEPG